MAHPQPHRIATVAVYAASAAAVDQRFLRHAYLVGRLIARQRWVQVNGGAATGLMAAATRGAADARGAVDCVSLRRFAHVEPPLRPRYRRVLVVDSMRERKRALFARADALVALPGGLGTLDELAEQMCARQLALHLKPIVVLNTLGFYDHLRLFIRNAQHARFIPAALSHVVRFVDTPEQLIHHLTHYNPLHTTTTTTTTNNNNNNHHIE